MLTRHIAKEMKAIAELCGAMVFCNLLIMRQFQNNPYFRETVI